MATLYIAGPMRGYERFNFDAFFAAEEELRKAGYDTINPARLDIENGFDPGTNPANVTKEQVAEFFRRDLRAIMSLDPSNGDGLALLDDWTRSRGAKAEVAVAEMLGLRAANLFTWVAYGEKRMVRGAGAKV